MYKRTKHLSSNIRQSSINVCSFDLVLFQISPQVAGKQKEIERRELICPQMSGPTQLMWRMLLMLIYWSEIPCRCATEVKALVILHHLNTTCKSVCKFMPTFMRMNGAILLMR